MRLAKEFGTFDLRLKHIVFYTICYHLTNPIIAVTNFKIMLSLSVIIALIRFMFYHSHVTFLLLIRLHVLYICYQSYKNVITVFYYSLKTMLSFWYIFIALIDLRLLSYTCYFLLVILLRTSSTYCSVFFL